MALAPSAYGPGSDRFGRTNMRSGGRSRPGRAATGNTAPVIDTAPPPLTLPSNEEMMNHPANQPGYIRPKAPGNGLAAFAKSDLGQSMNTLYGPSEMQNYGQAFQGALSAARGNISQMLNGALADISASQASAQKALGQYAPMVESGFDLSQGMADNAQKAISGALGKFGGPGVAKANLAPERLAMASTHQGNLADQALLDTGIAQQAQHERALAQLSAQERMGQLDTLEAQLAQQYAMAQMGQAHDVDMFQRQQAAGGINALRDFQLQQKLGLMEASMPPEPNINPAGGRYEATGLTQHQLDQVHQDPRYARFSRLIQAGEHADPKMIANVLADNPHLLAVLQTENPTFFGAATK